MVDNDILKVTNRVKYKLELLQLRLGSSLHSISKTSQNSESKPIQIPSKSTSPLQTLSRLSQNPALVQALQDINTKTKFQDHLSVVSPKSFKKLILNKPALKSSPLPRHSETEPSSANKFSKDYKSDRDSVHQFAEIDSTRVIELERKCNYLERTNSDLNQDISFNKMELETAKIRHKEKTKCFKTERSIQNNIIERLEKEVAQSKKIRDDYFKTIQGLKSELSSLMQENKKYLASQGEGVSIERIRSVQEKAKRHLRLVSVIKKEFTTMKKSIRDQINPRKIYDGFCKDIIEKVHEISNQAREGIKKLEMELDEKSNQINDLEQEINSIAQEKNQIQTSSLNDKHTIFILNEKLKELQNSSMKVKTEYERKVEEMKNEHLKEIEINNKMITDYQNQVTKNQSDITKLYRVIEDDLTNVQKLSEDVSALTEEKKQLIQNLITLTEDKLALNNSVSQYNTKLSRKKAKIISLSSELHRRIEENETVRTGYMHSQRELEEAKNLILQSQELFEKTNNNSMQYEEYASNRIKELEFDKKELNQIIKEKETLIHILETRLKEEREELLAIKVREANLNDILEKINKELFEIGGKFQQMADEDKVKEMRISTLQENKQNLDDIIEKQRAEIDTMHGKVVYLQNVVETLNKNHFDMIKSTITEEKNTQALDPIEYKNAETNTQEILLELNLNILESESFCDIMIDGVKEEGDSILKIFLDIEKCIASISERFNKLECLTCPNNLICKEESFSIDNTKLLIDMNQKKQCEQSIYYIMKENQFIFAKKNVIELLNLLLNRLNTVGIYLQQMHEPTFDLESSLCEKITEIKAMDSKIQEEILQMNNKDCEISKLLTNFQNLLENEIPQINRFFYLSNKIIKIQNVYKGLKDLISEKQDLDDTKDYTIFKDFILTEYIEMNEYFASIEYQTISISIDYICNNQHRNPITPLSKDDEIENLKNINEKHLILIEELENLIQIERLAHENRIGDLINEYNAAESNLTNEIIELHNEISEMQQEHSKITAELQKLRQKLIETNKLQEPIVSKAQIEANEAESKSKSQKIINLEKELQEYKSIITRLQEQNLKIIDKMKNTISDVDIESLKAEINSKSQKLITLEKEVQDYKASVDLLQKQQSKNIEIQENYQKTIETLENNLKSLAAEQNMGKTYSKSYEELNDSISAFIISYRNKLTILQEKGNHMKTAELQCKFPKLQELAELIGDLMSAISKVSTDEMESAYAYISEKYDEQKIELSQLQEENVKLLEQIQTLEAENTQLCDEIRDLQFSNKGEI